MLKDKTFTYVSLFSSAGVGCYGFKKEKFECIATNELISRRLDVQRANHKCKFDSGYISGDISSEEAKKSIYDEIDKWHKLGNDRVDVVVATPPCQGISVINHKKTDNEIKRNSLVVQSVHIVSTIKPKIFILENVMAFQKTLCMTPSDEIMSIGEYVRQELGADYTISGRILNFMNYGSNSSRTRTIMIGVDKKYRNFITPFELYPKFRTEKQLKDIIYDFPKLEWGEINKEDFYHAFRTYTSKMRMWIHDLKEGESAFDNTDINKRPHRIVDGKIIENVRKNRDKYTRQVWNKVAPCIHTRNDQLAAQNTLHPEQDRVFSVRELMEMMTIPYDFRWVDLSLEELNNLKYEEKRVVYKENEVNIRQCLGEAVPTEIMRQIANNIKKMFLQTHYDTSAIKQIASQYNLVNSTKLLAFLKANPLNMDISSLMHITEFCNTKKEENAAFYTNKFIINEIMDYLPTFSKDEIHILEPSVGAGGFIPFLFEKYADVPHVILDVVDIDEQSINAVKLILEHYDIPDNFSINYISKDFLSVEFPYMFDLVVGNPPFSKLKNRTGKNAKYLMKNINKHTTNLSELFLEKAIKISDNIVLVLNKTILSTSEFEDTRNYIRKMSINAILDFGRYGFTGVSIETMCLIIKPKQKPKKTIVYNMKFNTKIVQAQEYITDSKLPYFVIYRDSFFDEVMSKMDLNRFIVFRDRQITKSITKTIKGVNSLWVIKARNINDDGKGITHISGYDVHLDKSKAEGLSVYKYVNGSRLYLTPNMTYNPRVIQNIPNTIADGSVAILIPKDDIMLSDKQREYFSTDEYRKFYSIARNFSTQSINVDKSSVFFYGVLKNDK